MKTKTFSKDILTLAILTIITVFVWIGVDVYRALRKPTPPNIPAEQLLPLNPKLETRVIDDLTNRQMLERETLINQETVPEEPSNEENNINQ
ncbi:MAG: hypothetical protein Q8Q15_04170 [bacterium]|nr:hypothetical protein [bacterium]